MTCAEQNGVLRSRSPIPYSFYCSTSTGETNFSRTPRNIPLFPFSPIPPTKTGYHSLKRFWKGFGETFSSKRFPQETTHLSPPPYHP